MPDPKNADDWPVCWCSLSPGYGHLWDRRHCPERPQPKEPEVYL